MANKPVFVAAHPRACSTAFERVFMTQRDTLATFHEPFGDAYYYGPERQGARYNDDEEARIQSGFTESTYKTIYDRIMKSSQDKRVFIKDMVYYLFPRPGNKASIAPSLGGSEESTTAPANPTVIPVDILEKFHFAFLIRHPKRSIPSYMRCTVPPLNKVTAWDGFLPEEAGYHEQRIFFDYLRSIKQIGPKVFGQDSDAGDKASGGVEIMVIDADDLLDHPAEVVKAFCQSVGIEYSDSMLVWDTPEDAEQVRIAFEKWLGWHDDAINSTSLKPRTHKKAQKSGEELYQEWVKSYGEEGAKYIKQLVDENVADYEYLKQFAVKVGGS